MQMPLSPRVGRAGSCPQRRAASGLAVLGTLVVLSHAVSGAALRGRACPYPCFSGEEAEAHTFPGLSKAPRAVSSLGRRGTCFISLGLGSWEVTFFPEVAGCVHLRPGNVREVWEFIRTVAAAGGGSPGGLREGRPCWESREPLWWPRRAPTGSTSWARRLQRQRRRGTDGCGARPVSVGRGVRMPFIPLGLA